MDTAIRNEVFLIVLFAVAVFLFVCNFGVAGVFGDTLSDMMFGIFGLTAYVMPLVLFVMIAFGTITAGALLLFGSWHPVWCLRYWWAWCVSFLLARRHGRKATRFRKFIKAAVKTTTEAA